MVHQQTLVLIIKINQKRLYKTEQKKITKQMSLIANEVAAASLPVINYQVDWAYHLGKQKNGKRIIRLSSKTTQRELLFNNSHSSSLYAYTRFNQY